MEQESEYTRRKIIRLIMDNAELSRRNYILKSRIEIMENEKKELTNALNQLSELEELAQSLKAFGLTYKEIGEQLERSISQANRLVKEY